MAITLIENFRAVFYAPFYATAALGAYEAEGMEVKMKMSAAADKTLTTLTTGAGGGGHIGHAAAARGLTSYTTFNTTRSFIDRDPDTVLHMTRAMHRTLKWIAAHGGRDLAGVIAPYLSDIPLPAPAALRN